jgi:hypothetical protein
MNLIKVLLDLISELEPSSSFENLFYKNIIVSGAINIKLKVAIIF